MKGRYYSLNEYLREQFGEKVYKLSLELCNTCPNRDGTLHTRGCIFCHEGSSHFAVQGKSVNEQIAEAKKYVENKAKAKKFIAYFQSYTNTYAPIPYLKKAFLEACEQEEVVALSIGTRPDCLQNDVLELLGEINRIKPVWVELGLQTSKKESVEYIRRCYDNSVYEDSVNELKKRGITVVTHLIFGLPNESKEDMMNSVDFAVRCGTDGLKLQLLHILKGTDLYEDYKRGLVKPLTQEEYMDLVFSALERIPQNIVIHRITGDAPKKYLAEPMWSSNKKAVLNKMNRELERQNIVQGSLLKG